MVEQSKPHIWKIVKTLLQMHPSMNGRSVVLYTDNPLTNTCCFKVDLPKLDKCILPGEFFSFLLYLGQLTSICSIFEEDYQGKKWVYYELVFGNSDYDPAEDVKYIIEKIKEGRESKISYPKSIEILGD